MLRRWLVVAVLCAFAPALPASGTQHGIDTAVEQYNAGNYPVAERELRMLLERQPYSVEAHEYLGRTLLKLEQWAEAVQQLIRSYELMPEHRKRKFWLTLWQDIVSALSRLLEAGKWDEAVSALGQLWQLEAVSPDSRGQLAQVFSEHAVKLLMEGRLEEALAAFSQSEGIRSGDKQSL